ncbi:hypothetical protein HOY82DRAFT_491923, partial [Tuber indicum]
IYFLTFNLLQMSLFIVLLEWVLSYYNPPVRKALSSPSIVFLIQPPPSLQHCPMVTVRVLYSTVLLKYQVKSFCTAM